MNLFDRNYPQEQKPSEISMGDYYQNLYENVIQQFDQFNDYSRTLRIHLAQTVNIDSQEIKEMLISNIKKLKSLKCISIMLFRSYTKPSQINTLMDCLEEASPQITEFIFRTQRQALNKQIIEAIFIRLKNFKMLQKIQIEISQFTSTIPKAIAIHLQSLQNLKYIEYSAFDTPQANSVELFSELSQIKTIETLKLNYSKNCMSLEGSRALGRMISQLPVLKSLLIILAQTKIQQEATEAIGQGLSSSQSLQNLYLDFSQNQLKSDFLFEFAKQLKNLNKLISFEIKLNQAQLDFKTINALQEGIANMKLLTRLIFHNSWIYGGAKLLSEDTIFNTKLFSNSIKSLANLRVLDIQIYNSTFIPFLMNLKYCEFLEQLTFSFELSQDSQNAKNYSEKQIQKAFENLENIPKISYIFKTQSIPYSNTLTNLIASSIQNLHNTNDITLNFNSLLVYYQHFDLEAAFQNQCLNALLTLRDSVNHLNIWIQKPEKNNEILTDFSKGKNLYSYQIFQTTVINNIDMNVNNRDVTREILKSPRLVNYKIQQV